MKKRAIGYIGAFLVGLSLALLAVPATITADHPPTGKQFIFHWRDSQTIEMTTTFNSAIFTRVESNVDIYFHANVDFSAIEGCPSERGVIISIDRDVYENIDHENINTAATTPIRSGFYSTPGDRTCDMSDALVKDYLRRGVAVIGFRHDTNVSGFGPLADPAANERTCEDLGGLAWLACPVVRIVSATLDWADQLLISLLNIDEDRYNNPQMEAAWQNLRNLAYMILIPIMLIMVISTAVGFNFVSAYTVKSALPRMVAAVIFIAISFDAMVFMVNFAQAVGVGIQNIILSPFDMNIETTLLNIMPVGMGNVADWGILAGLIGLGIHGAMATGGGIALVFGLIGIVGTLALLLLLVTVLLLLREALIILLILMAPLAILSWIFPSRGKLFGLWSKTFWLMVAFFPLAMAAIAVGKVMAYVVAQ